MLRVYDFRDIPLLFMSEGEEDMGAPRKTRAELLDKIIQFIWDYQDKHSGTTPKMGVIGNHLGNAGTSINYYIALLVEEGRLNKISSHPFRATITDVPANKSAISRFKKLRERMDAADARERERIRENQEHERENEQRASDREAALALISDVSEAPTVSSAPMPARRTVSPDPIIAAVDSYSRNRSDYYAAQKAVKAEMPKLLKIADERDIVFELVSRGYTVAKNR
jgi:hypothetical protein